MLDLLRSLRSQSHVLGSIGFMGSSHVTSPRVLHYSSLCRLPRLPSLRLQLLSLLINS